MGRASAEVFPLQSFSSRRTTMVIPKSCRAARQRVFLHSAHCGTSCVLLLLDSGCSWADSRQVNALVAFLGYSMHHSPLSSCFKRCRPRPVATHREGMHVGHAHSHKYELPWTACTFSPAGWTMRYPLPQVHELMFYFTLFFTSHSFSSL